MLSQMDTKVSLAVKVLWKFISLICFRVYLEVKIHKNPTCFSRWSVRIPAQNIGIKRTPKKSQPFQNAKFPAGKNKSKPTKMTPKVNFKIACINNSFVISVSILILVIYFFKGLDFLAFIFMIRERLNLCINTNSKSKIAPKIDVIKNTSKEPNHMNEIIGSKLKMIFVS